LIKAGLKYNTFVAIPTGTGKTFVAAGVILNYYRWFPEGKIYFFAPTKPLVLQQLRGIKDTLEEIPECDMIHMTGDLTAKKRKGHYQDKRILFMTPQTWENDARNGLIALDDTILMIFDEAHRASGNYAYTNIVELMVKAQVGFRILALSATPGDSTDSVQYLISNLLIAKLKIFNETDIDLKRYMHDKILEIVQVNQIDGITVLDGFVLKVIVEVIRPLLTCKVLLDWSLL
jgi:ATP-dependent DNA helicase MPH1